MPRTKVSKSSKRNRETANREEKVREFENSLDGFQNTLEDKIQEYLSSYECEVKMLLERTPHSLLKMKMVDVFSLVSKQKTFCYYTAHTQTCIHIFSQDFNHLADWEKQKPKIINLSSQNSTLLKSKAMNPNDEGE